MHANNDEKIKEKFARARKSLKDQGLGMDSYLDVALAQANNQRNQAGIVAAALVGLNHMNYSGQPKTDKILELAQLAFVNHWRDDTTGLGYTHSWRIIAREILKMNLSTYDTVKALEMLVCVGGLKITSRILKLEISKQRRLAADAKDSDMDNYTAKLEKLESVEQKMCSYLSLLPIPPSETTSCTEKAR